MFEVKKYQWLLTELAKSKSKLKLLEVFFIRNDSIESGFYTGLEGIVVSSSSKGFTIKESLERFLNKRMNGLETSETQKPVAYMIYASYKKIAYISDVKEYIRKDQKLHNLKEIVLFQEYQHDTNAFYTLELYYDGEGLVSTSYRRDVLNSESMVKDNKFLFMTLNLSKYLVSSIEDLADKNVIRLKYDFVVDQNFCPVVLGITQIKLVHPKIFALNKGINVDGLENLTIVKNDYKGLTYPKIPTLIKEPDAEALSPVAVSKAASTSIFLSFIAKFLEPNKDPIQRKSTKKYSQKSISHQISPVPFSQTEYKSFEPVPPCKSVLPPQSPNPIASNPIKTNSNNKEMKLPELRNSCSSRNMFSKNYVFTGLQPSSNWSNFLKVEEVRLLENKLRRVNNSEMASATLPALKKMKKKKKKSKKVKKMKKVESAQRFVSPYEVLQTIK